jgi:hypothetical protein
MDIFGTRKRDRPTEIKNRDRFKKAEFLSAKEWRIVGSKGRENLVLLGRSGEDLLVGLTRESDPRNADDYQAIELFSLMNFGGVDLRFNKEEFEGVFAAVKKKCVKGISCGNACISASKICFRSLSEKQRQEVNRLRKNAKRGDIGAGEELKRLIDSQRAAKPSVTDKIDELIAELEQFTPGANLIARTKHIQAMKSLEAELYNTGMSREEALKVVDRIDFSETVNPEVREMVVDFVRLTNGVGVSGIRSMSAENPRAKAYYDMGKIDIGVDAASLRKRVFHEMGHFVEKDVGLVGQNIAWVKSRATGEEQPLRDLTDDERYRPDEKAYPDSFLSPYVGKVYGDRFTEVMSMGLEHFANKNLMLDLWEKDREHFKMMTDFLKEVRRRG